MLNTKKPGSRAGNTLALSATSVAAVFGMNAAQAIPPKAAPIDLLTALRRGGNII